jgi:hypothetical protein
MFGWRTFELITAIISNVSSDDADPSISVLSFNHPDGSILTKSEFSMAYGFPSPNVSKFPAALLKDEYGILPDQVTICSSVYLSFDSSNNRIPIWSLETEEGSLLFSSFLEVDRYIKRL